MQAPGSEVGRWFGPYELRSLLGRGGMGEVYEAYDTVKERVVALKLLSDALAGDPEYQIRFRRESQAAARLAEPHIIPIHDWGVIEGRLFIDMRLVQGTDLRAILQADGPLSPQRAVAVVEQIAAALDAAHEGGLVHRDVKPANILVTPADFAYLADFGIARHESDTGVTQAGVAVGSYTYMAPERFDTGPVTPRADIYSLACVLHECLTGATPFATTSVGVLIRSHLTETPPRASVQRTGLPAALDDVIAWGMAKDPHERFATAGELAVATRTALNSPARLPHSAGPEPHSGEPAAIPGGAGPSGPPTGGIPTLVVRMPQDEGNAPDSTTILPAIIPGDPTSVRPDEFEFTPLSADDPTMAADPEAPSSGIRPFPDAHLYQNEQLHPAADPSQYEDPAPATGGMPAADFYPHDQATRIYGGTTGYPIPEAEETTRVFQPVDQEPPAVAYSADAATRTYQPAQQYPVYEPGAHYDAPTPQAPPVEQYGSEQYGSEQYGSEQYGSEQYGYRADESGSPQPDPYEAAYEAGYRDSYAATTREREATSAGERSRVVPILIGSGVFALVVIIAVLGIKFLGDSGGRESAAAADIATTTAAEQNSAADRSTGPSATTSSRTTTSASPTTTTARSDLPAGAQPCTGSTTGRNDYGSAATGSAVTSCEFAEAVRQAYLDPSVVSAEGDPVSVEATSPVTGQAYTLECVAEDGLVTCRGGNNAIIYLY
ncbi:protein kinase domain-containing protein [Nocardia sp. NBC_01329]|uniref:serine/threonine-protein kinase n=1 Tax=Nocardia sp. NBC_01329 TaxID=2903594 RepID=UPI003FA34E48